MSLPQAEIDTINAQIMQHLHDNPIPLRYEQQTPVIPPIVTPIPPALDPIQNPIDSKTLMAHFMHHMHNNPGLLAELQGPPVAIQQQQVQQQRVQQQQVQQQQVQRQQQVQSNPFDYDYNQPSPLNRPPTIATIDSQINWVTGKEASSKPTDPSPLQEFKLPRHITQPTYSNQSLSDYNTYGTDNFHQEAKATPPTTNYNIPGTKNQESQRSDQSFRYLVQTPISTIRPSFSCNVCQANYPSRNKLFRHIRESKHYRKRVPSVPSTIFESDKPSTSITSPEVIRSIAAPATGSGLAFQNYSYIEIRARSTPDGKDTTFCADTGCGMSSMDKSFFKSQFPNAIIMQTPVPVEIRGIGNQIHSSHEYSLITFFLPGYKIGNTVTSLAAITREFHLINNLACNALIGNDIIDPEGIKLDVQRRQATISSCQNLTCALQINPPSEPVRHKLVKTRKTTILHPHRKTRIPIHINGLDNNLGSTVNDLGNYKFKFHPRFDTKTSFLAEYGSFPINTTISNVKAPQVPFITYYNNSDTNLLLRSNSIIGEISTHDMQLSDGQQSMYPQYTRPKCHNHISSTLRSAISLNQVPDNYFMKTAS